MPLPEPQDLMNEYCRRLDGNVGAFTDRNDDELYNNTLRGLIADYLGIEPQAADGVPNANSAGLWSWNTDKGLVVAAYEWDTVTEEQWTLRRASRMRPNTLVYLSCEVSERVGDRVEYIGQWHDDGPGCEDRTVIALVFVAQNARSIGDPSAISYGYVFGPGERQHSANFSQTIRRGR